LEVVLPEWKLQPQLVCLVAKFGLWAPLPAAAEDESSPGWKEAKVAKELGEELVTRLERDKLAIGPGGTETQVLMECRAGREGWFGPTFVE